MAKKKAKPKLDPRLSKLQDAYTAHRRKQAQSSELASAAGQAFADLSAKLAEIQIGDFIAVLSYGREIPAVVLNVFASANDWREDDTMLTWKIRYQQVKRDGTPHNGHSPSNVAGSHGDDFDAKWRKISKDVAASLATQQRV